MGNQSTDTDQAYAPVAAAIRGAPRSRSERETIISMVDAETEAEIYSSSPRMIRRLHRLSKETGIPFTEVSKDGVWIRVPSKCIRLSVTRQLSGASLSRQRELARQAREVKAAKRALTPG